MGGFVTALRKYATFSGRSRREEFWGFALPYAVIHVVLSTAFVIGMQSSSEGYLPPLARAVATVWATVALGLLVPWLAVSWRRFQDIGLPGALSLVGIPLPLVTALVGMVPGTVGDNRFGPDPKATAGAA